MYRIKQYSSTRQYTLNMSVRLPYASSSQSARYSAIVTISTARSIVCHTCRFVCRLLGGQRTQYTHVLRPIQRDLTSTKWRKPAKKEVVYAVIIQVSKIRWKMKEALTSAGWSTWCSEVYGDGTLSSCHVGVITRQHAAVYCRQNHFWCRPVCWRLILFLYEGSGSFVKHETVS